MVICDAFGRRSIDLEIVENMEMKLNLAFNFLTIFFDSVASSGNSVHCKLATLDGTEFYNSILFLCSSEGHISRIERQGS